MPALFDQGFFVRKPAWHEMGIVLDHFPGREEAMRLAGHDYEIREMPVIVPGRVIPSEQRMMNEEYAYLLGDDGWEFRTLKNAQGYKALVKKQLRAPADCDETNGLILAVLPGSYKPVQNPVCWDIIDALVGLPNVNYETGATLDEGRQCFVTAWVDEPMLVPGDDSPIYPYIAVNWRHDGMGAVKAIRTSVREVCANTVTMAEAEASRTGMEFIFRHTKNVMERIDDAKEALAGASDQQHAFMELATELAEYKITPRQRQIFLTTFIPQPEAAVVSDKVMANIEEARNVVKALLTTSPTVPDAHRDTGYGLLMAGTEYLDHLRGYRNKTTYVGRTLLRREPLKDKLVPMIREVAAA